MLLRINFDEKNVIDKGKSWVTLKVKYYAEFANGCYLATVKGSTKKDFDDAPKSLSGKTVFVGQKGGISLF